MKFLKIIIILFLLLLQFDLVFSQAKRILNFNTNEHHDSLIYKALSIKSKLKKKYNLPENIYNNKCGFSLQVEYLKKKEILSDNDKKLFQAIFFRDEKDTSILSSKKNFRIHYNKNGDDAPENIDKDKNGIPDFVDSVNFYFEYALDKMTNLLGYKGLVPDNNNGGGNEYDIYIENLSAGTYGYTTFEDMISEANAIPRYTSYITIDNRFNDFYTSGMNGLKITAAHELFHAIQIGQYGIWMDDVYYYEIFSTWMETFLHPEVKDYYQYLSEYFTSTSKPFWKHSGYDLTIWAIFLTQKYSSSIMKGILEAFTKFTPLKATEVVLNSFGKSLVSEYSDFSNWVYFTSYRAKNGFYFPEAKNYPLVSGSSLRLINFISPSCNINNYMQSLSTQYFNVYYKGDTISFISSKIDLNEIYEKSNNYTSSTFVVSENGSDSKLVLFPNGLKVAFTADNYSSWKNFFLINNDYLIENNDVKVFPNPSFVNQNSQLFFNVPSSVGDEITFSVLSNDLRLVYNSKKVITPIIGGNGFSWNCKDNNENVLSSGIYFYFIKSAQKEFKGKFSIVRK